MDIKDLLPFLSGMGPGSVFGKVNIDPQTAIGAGLLPGLLNLGDMGGMMGGGGGGAPAAAAQAPDMQHIGNPAKQNDLISLSMLKAPDNARRQMFLKLLMGGGFQG